MMRRILDNQDKEVIKSIFKRHFPDLELVFTDENKANLYSENDFIAIEFKSREGFRGEVLAKFAHSRLNFVMYPDVNDLQKFEIEAIRKTLPVAS